MIATLTADPQVQAQLAVRLAVEFGFYVFPVDHPTATKRCTGIKTREHNPDTCTERGKHPCCKWSEWSTTDAGLLVKSHYFGGSHAKNIGIDCGKSGLLVLDEDAYDELARFCADHGITLPPTLVVRTASGFHWYFRQPAGEQLGNREGLLRHYKINVRGSGGYVVGPGSLHASGVIYAAANGVREVAPVPTAIVDALKAREAAPNHDTADGAGEDAWWRVADSIEHPKRHEAMVAAAGWCRRMGLKRDEAIPVMRDVFARLDLSDGKYSWEQCLGKLDDVYARYEAGYRFDVGDFPPGQDGPEGGNGFRARDSGAEHPAPCTLDEVHAVFRRWLGDDYDLAGIDATLAARAAERLPGDPLWLLLISGSGNAKTETVQSLVGTGAHVVSTITGDGALLSGSPKKQRGPSATGGLLREIGDRGVLVIKDVTSILSMNHDARASVIAALREVHDGRWTRKLGVDGGRGLEWAGRIVVIGAVTTAWDRAHAAIASMGDRFLLLRMDSSVGRITAGRQSRRNVGHEVEMRAELAAAAAGVLATVDAEAAVDLTEEEGELLLAAADLVTLARTGVDCDYRGDVVDAHAPEMPTRFMKQLVQLVRGAVAIGMDRVDALRLAIRCARDSMPPLRLAIIEDLAQHPASSVTEVRRRLDKPRATVDRQLQSLHILGVVHVDEAPLLGKTSWRYSLAEGIDPETLNQTLDHYQISHPTDTATQERGQDEPVDEARPPGGTSKSGDAGPQVSGSRQATIAAELAPTETMAAWHRYLRWWASYGLPGDGQRRVGMAFTCAAPSLPHPGAKGNVPPGACSNPRPECRVATHAKMDDLGIPRFDGITAASWVPVGVYSPPVQPCEVCGHACVTTVDGRRVHPACAHTGEA